MGHNKSTVPNFPAVNISQLTQRVMKVAQKRKRKHTNLYARLNSLFDGGVFSVDVALVEDVSDALEAEHKRVMEFLNKAKNQLSAAD